MQSGFFLTAIWTLLLIHNGVQLSEVFALPQPGYLDFDNLPETNFTCDGKVIGGYYADIETGCQMFHVCTIGQKGDMTDIKFLCLNGTVFDQETRVCERVDEVDCSKSKDFYDLNLDLYNNGLPEDESGNESPKVEEEIELEEELYDENYDSDAPETASKGSTTTSTTTSSTTTTTTTTTTQRPIIYSTIKPFNIILPNLKNRPSGHFSGILSTTTQNKNISPHILSTAAPSLPQQTHYPSKNIGSPITGLVPSKNVQNIQFPQTQRPFSYITTPNYNGEQFKPMSTIDTGLKPPPSNYKPYTPAPPASTYKPPIFDPYKNHFFSSTPTSLTPIFNSGYSQKPQDLEEIRPSPESKRPVVVLTHHFPTINPLKNGYDDFTSFSSPSGPAIHPYVRQKSRPNVGIKLQPKTPQHPYLQQIQHHQHNQHQHPHKPNPTILALQSQQQKVHRLHQEGLEIAEHQIAQVASRNAEISNLRSQLGPEDSSKRDNFEPQASHRETKEIHNGDTKSFGKPAIAIVTSTSSTSSRVQKAPVITVHSVSSASGKPVINRINYKPETEYKSELEKLFSNTEEEKEEEKDPDMDLEQLLLAWKLKTNQEVTKDDIEKVFASLDTSKFKNGQTISLSDIFNLMSNFSQDRREEEITRDPPTNYDDYTEEELAYDPFYEDIPKVTSSGRQKRSSQTETEVKIKPLESVRTLKSDGEELRVRTKNQSATKVANPQFKGRRRSKFKYIPREEEVAVTPKPFPETGFTCKGKIPGGYYADTEANCELYHICADAGNGSLMDHKFFCGGGTKFNQRSRTCQVESLVECSISERYYHLNRNFLVPKDDEPVPEMNFEISKIRS